MSAPSIPADGNCRSCQAPIIWAVSAKTGRPMPIDVEPTAGANVELVAHAVRPDEWLAKVISPRLTFGRGDLRMAHHASCPQGKAWKRKTGLRG